MRKAVFLILVVPLFITGHSSASATWPVAQEITLQGDVQFVSDDVTKPLLELMSSQAAALLRDRNEKNVYIGYQVRIRESLRKAHWRRGKSYGGHRNVTVVGDMVYHHYGDGIEEVGSDYRIILHCYRKASDGAMLHKIRILDCDEDYRFTIPLVFVKDVGSARSIEALRQLTANPPSESLCEDAIPAVAIHEGPIPKQILKGLITGRHSVDLREDALFWFGLTLEGEEIGELQELESKLDHPDLREHMTFVYYMKKNDAAIGRLLHMARNDKSEDVREQAIFWLGQLAGNKIADELEQIVDEDPNFEVKKQAVFALSQMETSESLERLMRIARTNSSPAIRKQALFWISRSGDERAVDLLEEILLK